MDFPRLSWLNPGKGTTKPAHHHEPTLRFYTMLAFASSATFSAQAQDGALLVDVTKMPGAATNLEQSARSDDIDLDFQLNLEIAVGCLPYVSACQS